MYMLKYVPQMCEIPNKKWPFLLSNFNKILRGDLQAFLFYIWYALKDKIIVYILIGAGVNKTHRFKTYDRYLKYPSYDLNQAGNFPFIIMHGKPISAMFFTFFEFSYLISKQNWYKFHITRKGIKSAIF